MANKNRPTQASQKESRSARRDAAQAELRRVQARQRRSRMLFTAGVVVVVVVIIGALIVSGTFNNKGSGAKTSSASDQLVTSLSSIPASTYDTVGTGTTSNLPVAVSPPDPLTSDGKPKVLYVGAEYCPFCAAQRWAAVTALSRFGTFTGLGETTSSHVDVYPDTPTLSFHGSDYTSKYVAFNGFETQSNQVQGNSYAPLDTLPAEDQATFEKYDAPPYLQSPGSIPFIDYGGYYVSQGASFSPELLKGKTQQEVADAIRNPDTDISKAVLGTANVMTATICQLTKNQPSDVCGSAAVKAASAKLPQ